jgi:hypothetical protein
VTIQILVLAALGARRIDVNARRDQPIFVPTIHERSSERTPASLV